MSASTAFFAAAPCAAKAFTVQKSAFGRLPGLVQQRLPLSSIRPAVGRQTSLTRPAQRAVQTQVAQEIYETADLASFVGGTAATMFAMTLIGLAIGFVLLRVEALVEEGKI